MPRTAALIFVLLCGQADRVSSKINLARYTGAIVAFFLVWFTDERWMLLPNVVHSLGSWAPETVSGLGLARSLLRP